MMRTITLEIPEETYIVIKEQAESQGLEPTQVASELLAAVVSHRHPIEHDPLDDFIGSIESDVSDLAEHHHSYIGEAIWKETHGYADDSSFR